MIISISFKTFCEKAYVAYSQFVPKITRKNSYGQSIIKPSPQICQSYAIYWNFDVISLNN